MTHRTTTRPPAASPVGDLEFEEIRSLAAAIYDRNQQQAAALALTVQDLIHTRSHLRAARYGAQAGCDVCEIEHALDQLLDCACIPEGLALFKSLCRYYYRVNPAATAYYVHAYREMWDSEVDQEQETAP